ncbi:MAG TPA: RNA polymerase factor sigma-54 [Planctomycetota bacterium]|nr:RNA polymerase factor sigma-54 [Planctomycetota bacterium]
MKLSMQQTARPELQLRLSPQMLQRIEVLQLPALDLTELIEQELQENEALELAQDGPAEPAVETAESGDDDWEDAEWERREPGSGPTRMEVMAATAVAPVTLAEHLGRQLDMLELSPRERVIGRAILAALNDRGWLPVPLAEVPVELEPRPTAEELEHVLHLVQSLEPPGIGARDLTECLLLQLRPGQPDFDLLVTLVVQHLDDIAHNRIPRIARETGVGVQKVLDAIEVIQHLDPIPGRRFGGVAAPHVRPDVTVRRVGEDFEISIESDWIPDVIVSRAYRQMAADRRLDPELRKHIRGKIEGAQSLVEAIEQRKNTLFRVASELVNRQADFLEHGPAGLRPLRMQEVADALGVHVSTISRAISGKYLQTPRGIVPMKALFTGEVPARAQAEGAAPRAEDHASRAGVRELVREIVAGEDPRQPLSDEAIVEILKQRNGLEIARRTVTKYRKALGLGSSRDRRVYRAG